MAFCPYCGKSVEAGEICSCATGASRQSAPSYIGASRPAARPAGPRPAAPAPQPSRPAGAYPPPAAEPVQEKRAPMPERPAGPVQSAPAAEERDYFGPKAEPEKNFFGADDDGFAFSGDYYAPQSEGRGGAASAAEEEASFGAVKPAPASAAAGFVGDLTDMLARAVKLFRGNTNEALRESIESEGTSWLAVFGAYILFGTLAACFAIPRFIADAAGDLIEGLLGFGSGVIKYGDVLSSAFGGVLWRSLLINVLTVGIILATVVLIGSANKSKLPGSGVLNLAGMAFFPAAVLNVLGLLFSFFFPAGTLLCGMVSAVCTVGIVLHALAEHSGKRSLWTGVIAVCAVVAVWTLVSWLLMSGFLPGLFAADTPSMGGFMSF